MPLICATCQSQAPHGSHVCLYCGASLISRRALSPTTKKVLPQLQARSSTLSDEMQHDPLSSVDFDEGLDTVRSFPSSLLVHEDESESDLDLEYELDLSDSDIELIETHSQAEALASEESQPLLIADHASASPYEIPTPSPNRISGEFMAWNPQQTVDETLDGLPKMSDFEDLSASRESRPSSPARRVHLTDLKTPISATPIAKHRQKTTADYPQLNSSHLSNHSFKQDTSTEILSRHTSGFQISTFWKLLCFIILVCSVVIFIKPDVLTMMNHRSPSSVHSTKNTAISTSNSKKTIPAPNPPVSNPIVKPFNLFQKVTTQYLQQVQHYIDAWHTIDYQNHLKQAKPHQQRVYFELLAGFYLTSYEMNAWQELPLKKEWLTQAYEYIQKAQVIKASYQQKALKIRRAVIQKRMQLVQELLSETKELSKSTWLAGDRIDQVFPMIEVLNSTANQQRKKLQSLLKQNLEEWPVYALMYGLQLAQSLADQTLTTSWKTIYLKRIQVDINTLQQQYQAMTPNLLIVSHEAAPSKQSRKTKTSIAKNSKKTKPNIALSKLSIEQLYEMGSKNLTRGRTQKARMYFGKILEQKPNHINALAQLAWCAVDEGRFSSARTLFQKVLRQSASHADGIYGIAYVSEKMGDTAAARKYFESYLSRYPQGAKSTIVRRKLQNLSQ